MRKQVLILGHNDATQFIDIYNQYTRLFDKKKYEVTVAFLTGASTEATRERTIAEHVLFLDIPKKHIRTLKIQAVRKLLKQCREKQYSIIICHRYKPTYIMLWVSKFYPVPVLVCIMHELRTMASISRQLLVALLARKNTILAGVSDAVRDDMRKNLWYLSKECIVTLHNVIDVEMTEPEYLSRHKAREALHLSDDTFIFGNVARLAHNKDQATLIHAFSLIKPYCPNSKLIIIGDGELEQILQQKVKDYHLTKDVIFTGFLPGGFRYMKAFDCFILTSIQEAFGRVLLEAMLAKVPVIASAVNDIPEVVADAGVLVKPKDSAGFAIEMRKIYDTTNKAHAELGNAAYQHVAKNYSIPHFHKQFWQLPLIKTIKEAP